MTAPHEMPNPGRAADFAETLAAQLPVIETARLRLRAPRLEDFDAWAEIFTGPAGPHLGGPFDRDEAFTEFAATCGLRGHGVWRHRPVARTGVSTRVETERRRDEDAIKTSEMGE